MTDPIREFIVRAEWRVYATSGDDALSQVSFDPKGAEVFVEELRDDALHGDE